MEIILATVVASAVIFFGALISMGNERQRKAIDGLREQVTLWAIQDLKIKYEKLAVKVKIEDPVGWLRSLLSNYYGQSQTIRIIEKFENPTALVCDVGSNNLKIILTPCSPANIRQIARSKKSRISEYDFRNPLLSLPRNAVNHEFSALNNSITFNAELPIVWKELTGNLLIDSDSLWMYEI